MWMGFFIGLGASLHCLGMCGPIALAIPLNRTNNITVLSGILQYNLGRITTYALLGLLFGLIGISFQILHWMQWMSILAGFFMIAIAWNKISKPKNSRLTNFITSKIGQSIGGIMKSHSPFKRYYLGVLNGLLPCGMVFIGLANALIQGNVLSSMIAMFLFGIGTAPLMIITAFFASKITNTWRLKLTKFIPYIMTILGVIIIVRGMNLGIPYLSPRIETSIEKETAKVQDKNITKPIVVMSCCSANEPKNNCNK